MPPARCQSGGSQCINGNVLSSNYHKVPTVIHSALEIAAVGLTEDLAEQAGFDAEWRDPTSVAPARDARSRL